MRISRKDNPLKDQEKQCIDMFVFDPIPAGRFLAGFKKFVIFTLQGMMKRNVDYSRYSFGNRILVFGTHLLGLFVPRKQKLKMYHRVSQWKGRGESGLLNVYNVFFAYVGRTRYKREILSGYTMLAFEGRKYMSVAGYDSYLTELYGDYMKLPPEADRNSSHEVE